MPAPLLELERLTTLLPTAHGLLPAVDGVDLVLQRGSSLGLVGESGSGKTMLARSLLRLAPDSAECRGAVRLDGVDLLGLPERELRAVRGRRIAMVFQEPASALNPTFTIGAQLAEALRLHGRLGRAAARARSVDALREVGLADPERRLDSYPHELSGGMRQRALLAMALACDPDLLIADEPTTALDVTVQAQILELLGRLRRTRGMALLLISHDLDVVAQLCERIAVMYAGRLVELGAADALLARPAHPYTGALLEAGRPLPGSAARGALATIPGRVPGAGGRVHGCAFAPRCPRAAADCGASVPDLREVGPAQRAACLHPTLDAPRLRRGVP